MLPINNIYIELTLERRGVRRGGLGPGHTVRVGLPFRSTYTSSSENYI